MGSSAKKDKLKDLTDQVNNTSNVKSSVPDRYNRSNSVNKKIVSNEVTQYNQSVNINPISRSKTQSYSQVTSGLNHKPNTQSYSQVTSGGENMGRRNLSRGLNRQEATSSSRNNQSTRIIGSGNSNFKYTNNGVSTGIKKKYPRWTYDDVSKIRSGLNTLNSSSSKIQNKNGYSITAST
jgi:hypothetical protein